jgi:hypothetical protein
LTELITGKAVELAIDSTWIHMFEADVLRRKHLPPLDTIPGACGSATECPASPESSKVWVRRTASVMSDFEIGHGHWPCGVPSLVGWEND